jgi:hypothetical protein
MFLFCPLGLWAVRPSFEHRSRTNRDRIPHEIQSQSGFFCLFTSLVVATVAPEPVYRFRHGGKLGAKEYKVCKSKVGMKDSYVIRLQLIFRCPIIKKLGSAA